MCGGSTDVILRGLTLENGLAPTGTDPNETFGFADSGGGGILDEGNNLTITDCVVTNNEAKGSDAYGGFAFGGGIYQAAGTLTIADSTISDNKARAGAAPCQGRRPLGP